MLTATLLARLYPRAQKINILAFESQAPEELKIFEIDKTETRLHFFLAQLGHESGGLTVTVENMNYTAQRIIEVWPSRFASIATARSFANKPEKLANEVYASRIGNGPPASGDGFRYRGRGYIQITGRDSYRKVGALTGLDLEASPDLAATPEHPLRVACAFWHWKGINLICDTGDFIAVTRKINGSAIGIDDRRAWLDKVQRIFAESIAVETQPLIAEVIAIQHELRVRGYEEIGAADGIIGPRTIATITHFRQVHGLPAGIIDNQLRAALGLQKS